jgi:hypothetical protein
MYGDVSYGDVSYVDVSYGDETYGDVKYGENQGQQSEPHCVSDCWLPVAQKVVHSSQIGFFP